MAKQEVAGAAGAVIEGLEPRLLLSGNVILTSVGTTLVIRGDAAANQIGLAMNAGAIQVTSLDATLPTTVVNRATTLTGIKNIKILMGSGDDVVQILSPLTGLDSFNFNGGSGDNQLLNTTTGNDAVAASGSVTAALATLPTAGTENLTFTQTPAVNAVGSVTINSLVATAATATISLPGFAGLEASGALNFSAQPAAGNTVTFNDGTNPAQTFTAIASGVPTANQFLIAATPALTMTNLVAAVNAVVLLNTLLTQAVPAVASATATNGGVVGAQANGGASAVGANISVVQMAGGVNPIVAGDSIRLSDGSVNPALTFVATVGAPVLATDFQIGISAAATLTNLAARINLIGATLNLTAVAGVITNDTAGKAGNTAITYTGSAWLLTANAFAGGADILAAGDTVVLNDGINPAVTFTLTAGAPVLITDFQLLGSAALTAQSLRTAINAVKAAGTFFIGATGAAAALTLTVDMTQAVTADGANAGKATLANATVIPADRDQQLTIVQLGDVTAGVNAITAVPGDTVTLNDGVNPAVVLTAVAVGTTPTAIQFVADPVLATAAANFTAAVNGAGLNLSATSAAGVVTMQATVVGPNGIIAATIVETSTNIAEGAITPGTLSTQSTIVVGNSLIIGTTVFTAISTAPVAGSTNFQIGADNNATLANLADAINATAALDVTATLTPGVTSIPFVTIVSNTRGTAGNIVGNRTGGLLGFTGLSGGFAAVNSAAPGPMSIAKDFIATVTGSGDNVIDLLDLTVGRNLIIHGGSGVDNATLTGVIVTGATRISLGAGEDWLTVDGSTFNGTVLANLGTGDDILLIDQGGVGSTFKKGTKFMTGGGADLLADAAVTKYTMTVPKTDKVSFRGVKNAGALLNDTGLSLGVFPKGVKPLYVNVDGLLA